ncbi:MAG: beta-lactamase family protein [Acidimicrobiia bacterium]|nr:beta-lactamase family protein [Acidimicrobiia bacterium]
MGRSGVTARRLLGYSGLCVVGLVVLWIGVSMLVYSPTYVARVLEMRESSQGDYLQNFPTRTIVASSKPFSYPVALDPAAETRLASALETDDLQGFLESTNTQALIVIEDDTVIVERYANGAERDTMLTSFSVAKSFDSALVGIAIDEGFIGGVDDPITDYLPELGGDESTVSPIRIADLLTMSSGLEYAEMRWALFNGDDPITTYHPDQREVALEAATRVVGAPGREFQYNKYHPQLLGMILERTTGLTVTEFTQSRLWEPMGMEYDGQWTLDSESAGFEKMEAGLNARAIDFAKLGSLYLADGDWNGSEIVPPAWVEASVSFDPDRDRPDHYRDDFGRWIHQDGNGWYGYFWYGRARDGSDPDFFAEGDHGQFVYVSPSADTVIVRMGTEFGLSSGEWIDTFYEYCGS